MKNIFKPEIIIPTLILLGTSIRSITKDFKVHELKQQLSRYDNYPTDAEIRKLVKGCNTSPGLTEYFSIDEQGKITSEIEMGCY